MCGAEVAKMSIWDHMQLWVCLHLYPNSIKVFQWIFLWLQHKGADIVQIRGSGPWNWCYNGRTEPVLWRLLWGVTHACRDIFAPETSTHHLGKPCHNSNTLYPFSAGRTMVQVMRECPSVTSCQDMKSGPLCCRVSALPLCCTAGCPYLLCPARIIYR